MTLRRLGELGLIRRIRDRVGPAGASVQTGIGDDAAVLDVAPGAALLATTDLLIEDVHFRRTWAAPRDIGWKAMAVNLSDVAAMGGTPRWALVALAVPEKTEPAEVDALYAGMQEAAAPHGVSIVGGDTCASRAGWLINVTLLGEHAGSPRLRSAAKPGDAVAVTGSLGRAGGGLAVLEMGRQRAQAAGVTAPQWEALAGAHLRPTARVAEGRWLGAASGVHAMLDCSDGLSTDLGHVCRESGVGARVVLDRVPVAPEAQAAAKALKADATRWAVSGGEDYELLVTCDPAAVEALTAGLARATGTPLTVIGEIEGLKEGVVFVDSGGVPVAMPGGYDHFNAGADGSNG
jgi:thiamine-monophosphate kinase